MIILAFETSCDDTSIAIVKNGSQVLSSIQKSQKDHNIFGGVVPELAAREHEKNWKKTLSEALDLAKISIDQVDYFAVTQGPGLSPALLVGTTIANFFSLFYQKKIIPVNHILGHMCSVFLEREIDKNFFPALVLTVSGGHTQINILKNSTDYCIIGSTLDDAAGEAFDKVAKMLNLGYPGGPIISEKAKNGDPYTFKFPCILLEKNSLDFSFSGLKSAVYRKINEQKNISEQFICDICASFQHTVSDIFVKKINRALQNYPKINNIFFVGGVSANEKIKADLSNFFQPLGKKLFTPKEKRFSTDNAAMIASAAYFLLKENPDIAKIKFLDFVPKIKNL